jgi:hypothetical protein
MIQKRGVPKGLSRLRKPMGEIRLNKEINVKRADVKEFLNMLLSHVFYVYRLISYTLSHQRHVYHKPRGLHMDAKLEYNNNNNNSIFKFIEHISINKDNAKVITLVFKTHHRVKDKSNLVD